MKKIKLIVKVSSETEFTLDNEYEEKSYEESKASDFDEVRKGLIELLEDEGFTNVTLDKFEMVEVE